MSLEEIFYLSQSIASVAVVGSLIYLGLQVRASDRGQRSIKQRSTVTARASVHTWVMWVFGLPGSCSANISEGNFGSLSTRSLL